MAKYDINGGTYDFDESLKGDALNTALQQTADYTAGENRKKFLNLLSKAEGAEYDTIVGGKQKITDFSAHPNVVGMRTADGPSTAAGRYQITGTTFRDIQGRAGVSDFTPESQDKMAITLIERRGALDDVNSGNFNGAIAKLGKEWASLPSSTSTQPKRSQQWVDQQLGQAYVPPKAGELGGPTADSGFQAWGPVVKNNDQATLKDNTYWVSAAKQIYQMEKRKAFVGTDEEVAEYGKEVMGQFNNNVILMTNHAAFLAGWGSQEDKNAFLYMMDQYDENNMSWAGAGRAALGQATDPANLVGLGTLGTATIGKIAASMAAKQAIRRTLMASLGRTGVQAGILGGAQAGLTDTIKQGVEVTGGKKDGLSVAELAGHVGLGAGAGLILGTGADALLTAAVPAVQRTVSKIAEFLGMGKKETVKVPIANPSVSPAPAGPVAAAGVPAPPSAAGTVVQKTPGENAVEAANNAAIAANKAPAPDLTLVSDKLPQELTGAKLNWKTSEMVFESDLDRALFVTAQNSKSRSDGKYREWLKTQGFTEAEIDAAGAALKADVKQRSKGVGDGEVFDVPSFTKSKRTPDVIPEATVADTAAAAKKAVDDTEPLSTAFTTEELLAMGAREQKGRLWVDDYPVALPLNARHANALVLPASTSGLRATVQDMAKLTADATTVTRQLDVLNDVDLRQTLEVLRTSTALENVPVVFRAVQIMHDESKMALSTIIKDMEKATPEQMNALITKRLALEERMYPIARADDAMGSHGGSINRQRQEGLVGLQGASIESLMRTMGISKADAEKMWMSIVAASQVSSKAKQVAGEYEMKIAAALEKGDLGTAGKLTVLKLQELAAIAEEAAPGGASALTKQHGFWAGVKEVFISNLFTVKTVVVNLVPSLGKTLTLPAAQFLASNPLERSAQVALAAHYSAIGSTLRGAFSAAVVAFKYEQSILTRGSAKMMEGEMVITGIKGGALRFFPRVLNATDEFLAHINYAGFVAGKAGADATIEGTAKGLKGKDLKDFVSDALAKAKEGMYAKADDQTLQPIVNKGVNLGLSGDALTAYVSEQSAKSGTALAHGSNEAALDLTRDVLYKRSFSGKSLASRAAQQYEAMSTKAPAVSVILGQLFFRTPIRVFEEGIRLTPGINLLAPGFINDLRGANGSLRQVRAQGEAMVGMAITGSALALFASGSITGSGAYDTWKQDKNRKDSSAPEPYTIKFADGSTWNYKNLDPIATPIKIMVNAFEGMQKLHIKEAQDGSVNKEAWRAYQARLYVATAAVTSAITDANLMSGVKGLMDLASDAANPEKREGVILKKAGDFLAMTVPNTMHKIMQMNDPGLRDPATFMQIIDAKLGHGAVDLGQYKSSNAYDPLGQVRTTADVGGLFNVFSTSSVEERVRGNTPEHQIVMLELDRLTKVTGATFSPPSPKNPLTGDLDLRTMMTKDGQETMYDRWQRIYRDSEPDKILAPIAAAPLPEGTYKYKGIKVNLLQTQMAELQKAAFFQLMTEERLRDRMMFETTQKAKAQGGLLDFSNPNK